jgi:hypothetical protein
MHNGLAGIYNTRSKSSATVVVVVVVVVDVSPFYFAKPIPSWIKVLVSSIKDIR